MSTQQAIDSYEEQQKSLRDALKALLFLRAKASAETGIVPSEIAEQLSRLQRALLHCAEQLDLLRRRALVERVNQRADLALAHVEVEMALS